jgi:hypothetical protein
MAGHGEPVRLLEEVLPSLTGLIELEPLARAVEDAVMEAGILIDEEVHWIGPIRKACRTSSLTRRGQSILRHRLHPFPS